MRNLLLLMLLPILVIGCSDDDEPDVVVVTSVQLDRTELELQINGTYKFSVSYSPVNAEKPNYEWSSSNSEIVSVNSEGEVTALSVGEATITLTAKQQNRTLTSSCAISVLPINTTSITLNKTSLELTIGEEETLTYIIEPENATNKDVEWKSTNPEIASVDNGKVKAILVGMTTIEVSTKDDKSKATCSITVNPVYVTSIALNKTSLELYPDQEEALTYTIAPENATNKDVEWKSSNSGIATVDNGVIKAISVGETIIEATSRDGKAKAMCSIKVKILTINVDIPGTLSTLLTGDQKANVKSLSITGTLSSEDYLVFYEMPLLKYLDLSLISNETMPYGAFTQNYNLREIKLPNNLIAIPEKLCYHSNITTVDIPESVITIGKQAFENACLIGPLEIPNNVKTIEHAAFYSQGSLTGDLIIPNSVTTIGSQAFAYCNGFTGKLVLSENLKCIEHQTFYQCYNFSGVLNIPENIETIEETAFAYCNGFTKLILNEGLITIKGGAFGSCNGLTGDLIIPNTVITVGDHVFSSCLGFNGNLVLGSGISSLGYAFQYCQFNKIYCKSQVPFPLQNELILPNFRYLGVPIGSKDNYKNESFWSNFLMIEEVDFGALEVSNRSGTGA